MAKTQRKLKYGSETEIFRRDIPRQPILEVHPVRQKYEARASREIRSAKLGIIFLNSVLIFYTGFLFLSLTERLVLETEFDRQWLLYWLPFSLVVGVVWSISPHSLGAALIRRTNRVLKKTWKPTEGTAMKKFSIFYGWTLIVLTSLMAWLSTQAQLTALFSSEGLSGAGRIFSAMFHPEWKILGLVITNMIETIYMALMATMLAIPIAFGASFFCARNLMKANRKLTAAYYGLRLIFNFTRSVEPLIWAIIFSVWVGIGPFAGMLALMLHSVASLSKLYSEQIENIEAGPVEAIEATGANRIQVIWYAVVPQIVLPFLSFTIYRWDINIRMATVIGLVGGGGIGTLLMQAQGLARWNEVGTIILVIGLVVWTMDYLSAKIREAIY